MGSSGRLAWLGVLWAVACSSSSGAGSTPSGDAGSPADTGSPATDGGSPDAAPGMDSGSAVDSGPIETGTKEAGGGPEAGAPAYWVVGYYSSWDAPSYPVAAIDWDGLTHVAAAFYIPDGHGAWSSGTFDQATAQGLIAAAHAHGKKAIASIGGASSGPGFEGSMQTAMSKFIDALGALLALGFDGLDIDWEGGNLTAAQDQTLQTQLIGAIRTKTPGILLTLTAGIENENNLDDLSWYGTIAAQVDQINLMSYGMSGAYQGWQSWHSSPLHWNHVASTPTGIDASVSHYLAANVPAGKLGVGSGFYGECYTAPVTAPVQALNGSQVAASDNAMAYKNVQASLYSAGAYHYDSAAEAPYLTLDGSNGNHCTYVSYEDATSLAAKNAWIKSQHLGGIIIWTISEGYVASGATVADQNPLLEVMKTTLLQ